jgi:hypothetical protein
MPQMNGAQVQQKILELYPHLAFVLCSGNALAECPGIDVAKVFGFILKPEIFSSLKIVIEEYRLKQKKGFCLFIRFR